jgi:histidine triad (HIT) family protein
MPADDTNHLENAYPENYPEHYPENYPEHDLVSSASCTFCGIVRGERDAEVVFQSDSVLAFMDLLPMTRGHCLVIPRTHRQDLLHLDAVLGGQLIDVSRRVGQAFLDQLGALGFNLLTNTGHHADQSQFHVHFHLIPRYGSDRLLHPWERKFGHWPTIQEVAAELRLAPSLSGS